MSSPPQADPLRDIADDLRIVCEIDLDLEGDAEVGLGGDVVCIVGTGIGVVACAGAGFFQIVEFGLSSAGISLIGSDVVCLACLLWVTRRARSRSQARGIKKSLVEGWSHIAAARLLGIAVQLFLPADVRWVKWEEWCAELACIESRWQKTMYLLDLLGKMYRVARAAREGGKKGRP